MSHLSLANLLNGLARNHQALISEGVTSVVVSNLLAGSAIEVAKAASQLSWAFNIADSHSNACDIDELDTDFEPFRITLEKSLPSQQEEADDLFIVSEVGFRNFLRKGHCASRWHIIGLTAAFITRARAYCEWDESVALTESPATKSARLLVKESGSERTVPEDVRHWLLADGCALQHDNPLHVIWSSHALDSLSRCLANEIDSGGTKLIFKGPPKLHLTIVQTVDGEEQISLSYFDIIQEAAAWVFDNAREAEVKHILLSAEIARSGRADGVVHNYLRDHLAEALDCAKIAYQMALSEITKDTLKSLGDLRKAVTEETSKVTDATRQAVAAITTALTVGVGLIAARLSVQVNPYVIVGIMGVAFGYTVLIVMSGRQFIGIQQQLRNEWQPKLYRFLSANEFEKMVGDPIRRSEVLFDRVSRWGLRVLALSALGTVIFVFAYSQPVPATSADSPPLPPKQLDLEKRIPKVHPPTPSYFDWGMTAYISSESLLYRVHIFT